LRLGSVATTGDRVREGAQLVTDLAKRPFDVVVLAGSTGGIRAMTEVVGGLPPTFPVPVVVVQHRLPDPDLLPGLLDRRTALPVGHVRDGQPLDRGVHVLPARRAFGVDGDRLLRDRGELATGQADHLMRELVVGSGQSVCAVVLTGRGHDGAAGVRAVKRAGGWVLVQDPTDAAAPEMPTAALATGCADLALPLPVLSPALVALAMAPGVAPMFRRAPAPWAHLTAG
jgi:two-component system chemotaxis response regulator CheB